MRDIYHHLYNTQLYNGVEKSDRDDLIKLLKAGYYDFQPPKRFYKGNRLIEDYCDYDNALLGAIAFILTAYYEPQFNTQSHGFRHNRSQRTALDEIRSWNNVDWYEHLDIEKCFQNIDRDWLYQRLREDIQDQRFRYLVISHLLMNRTAKGISTGSPLSPLLCNLFLTDIDNAFSVRLHYLRYADNLILAGDRYIMYLDHVNNLIEIGNSKGLKIRLVEYDTPFLGCRLMVESNGGNGGHIVATKFYPDDKDREQYYKDIGIG